MFLWLATGVFVVLLFYGLQKGLVVLCLVFIVCETGATLRIGLGEMPIGWSGNNGQATLIASVGKWETSPNH